MAALNMDCYPRLKIRIFQERLTLKTFADKLGRSYSYVSNRLNAKDDLRFDTLDVFKAGKILHIPQDELLGYFSELQRINNGR